MKIKLNKETGEAFITSDKGSCHITCINFDKEKLEERSLKYMAPFIEGTIRRMKNDHG